jgi:hypothetical protein
MIAASFSGQVQPKAVMPGLDPGIHGLPAFPALASGACMAGSSPAMTILDLRGSGAFG